MTPTAGPTATTAPEKRIEPRIARETIWIRYSHYWPPLGGVNTSMPWAPHLARCANGDRWQDWVGRGVACPPDLPLGAQIEAFGTVWTCVDRGGKIKWPWVDFLTAEPHAAYGAWIEAKLVSE